MRIVFVNKYYPPFNASTSHLLCDLACEMAKTNDVTVVTGSAPYAHDDAGKRPPKHEWVDNVEIRRVWCIGATRRSTLGRFADYLSFYTNAFFRLLFQRRCDVLVVMTTPPLLSLPGMLVARLRGSRLVLWNMDTYPDALSAIGMLSEKSLSYRFLQWLARRGYKACDRVIVLDRYMSERIQGHGVSKDRIQTCSNWDRAIANGKDRANRSPASQQFRNSVGANEDSIVFLYFGNLSLAHDIGAVIAGMKEVVAKFPQAVFAFVGGGRTFDELKEIVNREKIARIHFTGYVPKEDVAGPLLASDVGLVLLKSTFVGVGTPSKLYSLMASGLPVLYVGPSHSEVADVIREVNAGVQVDDTDSAGFFRACESYITNAEMRREHGRNALGTFQSRYEKSMVVARLSKLIAFESA